VVPPLLEHSVDAQALAGVPCFASSTLHLDSVLQRNDKKIIATQSRGTVSRKNKKRFDPGRIKPLILIKDFMLPLRSEISSLSGKNFTGYFHSFIYIVLSIRIV